jgi:maltose alpha-D-glucosyltransferase/alpha-amylase
MKVRNEQQTFGRGSIEFVETLNPKILAYIRRHADNRILVVANLAGTSQPAELLLGRYSGSLPIEMLGGIPFRRIGATPYSLSFPPYGFYWFALTARAKRDVPPMYRDVIGTPATSGPPGVAAFECAASR